MKKYRIYCETDGKYEYIISSSEPLECPVDDGHSVDTDSIAIVNANPDINDGTLNNISLGEHKNLRYKQIDIRTGELISAGFTFDGENFSLSQNAQLNWVGLKSLETLITFPINVTTKGDGEYSLAEANLNAFIGAGKAAVQAHLDSGRALKVQVSACVSIAEVNAVADNR